MPRVVLITGVSRPLGSRFAARLAADESIDRIIGVDTAPPRGDLLGTLGRTEFVRADIRNPLIAKVVTSAKVDTVVHLNLLTSSDGVGGRAAMKEINVIGAMQLLAACQKAASLRRFVVKSTTEVYGSSPRDPAYFTESAEPKSPPASGLGRDALDVEQYVRGFARRRPDVKVAILRFAEMLGPGIDTSFTRYLSRPVTPTVLGFDPRIQFVHVADVLSALEKITKSEHHGSYNVAGDGVLLLSQALRRAGRLPVPLPSPAAAILGSGLRQLGTAELAPDQVRFLQYGRVVDTSKAARELGFRPRFSTPEAFDDFVRSHDLTALIGSDVLAELEGTALSWLHTMRTGKGVGDA